MKTKDKLLLFSLILLLIGCGERFCEGFPDELVVYFPYQEGQDIIFINRFSDSLVLKVNTFDITEDYFTDRCGKCNCVTPACGFSTQENNRSVGLGGTMGVFTKGQLEFNCTINDSNESIDKNKGNHFNKTFEIKNINDSIFLENNNNLRFDKLVIVKNIGFVSFHDKQLNSDWNLIED